MVSAKVKVLGQLADWVLSDSLSITRLYNSLVEKTIPSAIRIQQARNGIYRLIEIRRLEISGPTNHPADAIAAAIPIANPCESLSE